MKKKITITLETNPDGKWKASAYHLEPYAWSKELAVRDTPLEAVTDLLEYLSATNKDLITE